MLANSATIVRVAATLSVMATGILTVTACSTSTQTASPTTTPQGGSASTTSAAPADTQRETGKPASPGGNVKVVFGDKTHWFTKKSCHVQGESDLVLTAVKQDRTELTVSAKGMKGSMQAEGSSMSVRGTVTMVSVGDLGNFTAEGQGTVADDSVRGPAQKFTITGSCA